MLGFAILNPIFYEDSCQASNLFFYFSFERQCTVMAKKKDCLFNHTRTRRVRKKTSTQLRALRASWFVVCVSTLILIFSLDYALCSKFIHGSEAQRQSFYARHRTGQVRFGKG